MRAAKLATLKFFSLLFLLPGLAGLIISAMISTHYVDTLPKWSTPEESRIIPRNINGTVVYQTPAEDQKETSHEGLRSDVGGRETRPGDAGPESEKGRGDGPVG